MIAESSAFNEVACCFIGESTPKLLLSFIIAGKLRDFIPVDSKNGNFYYVFMRSDLTLNFLSEDARLSFVMLFDIFLSLMNYCSNIEKSNRLKA